MNTVHGAWYCVISDHPRNLRGMEQNMEENFFPTHIRGRDAYRRGCCSSILVKHCKDSARKLEYKSCSCESLTRETEGVCLLASKTGGFSPEWGQSQGGHSKSNVRWLLQGWSQATLMFETVCS